MDSLLLSQFMVQAAKDGDSADDFNLKVITDSMGYRLAQNLYRLTAPMDEEGNPAPGGENMALFPSYLVRLDNLLQRYKSNGEGGDNEDSDDDDNEKEDSENKDGSPTTTDDDDNSDDDNESDDDNDDDNDSDNDDDDDDDDLDDDSDMNDEDENDDEDDD